MSPKALVKKPAGAPKRAAAPIQAALQADPGDSQKPEEQQAAKTNEDSVIRLITPNKFKNAQQV